MKTNQLFTKLAAMFVVLLLGFTACTKSGLETDSTVSVFLTDGPGDYDNVFIDIVKVEVKVDKDEKRKRNYNAGLTDDDKDDHLKRKDEFGEWIDINYTQGVIDVLSLRNGVETQLGTANIQTGTVRKIRITLGTNNAVVKNGVSYPLTLANPTQNFLYVHLFDKHRQGGNNNVRVWVDFDIARSIVENNGRFFLKPLLRPFCNNNFGEIAGTVLPIEARAVIKITNANGFEGFALPNRDGRFMIRGLEEGTYTVLIEGNAPYQSQTISNVGVTKGKLTKLETVTLKQ